MAKRIFEKAELIPIFQPGPRPAPAGAGEAAKSKTAPGTMMGFLTQQSTAIQEAESLRAEVKTLRDSSPLRALDPATVRPSKWANRHAATFLTTEFDSLKSEIQAAGENVQPIKVRPLPESDRGARFEVIYGHRRHRACLELGLPVNALVQDADDVSLFEQMERENRGRKNLSAWEQGKMYRRALDEGLYPSQRKLAERLGVDLALVSKSLALARLPDEVVESFASPLDIQFRWAAVLTEAMQKDPDGMLDRARAIKAAAEKPRPADVMAQLTRVPSEPPAEPFSMAIEHQGKPVGQVRAERDGKVTLVFKTKALTQARAKSLVRLVEEFLVKSNV